MDKYRIRRTILDATQEMEPAPTTLDVLARYPLFQMAGIKSEQLLEHCTGLVDHGYLRNLHPTRKPVYRLTPAGRDQVTRDAELDEYVWGDMAL